MLYIRDIIIQCFCEQVPETGEVGDHGQDHLKQRELLYFYELVSETGEVGDHGWVHLKQRELILLLSSCFCEQVPEIGEVGDHGRDHLKQREFTFDHSFWSANPSDPHFVKQEQVSPSIIYMIYIYSVKQKYNIYIYIYICSGSTTILHI